MSKLYTFSPKERELMEILWDAEEPLSRQDILARAEQRQVTWKPNSIYILLNALFAKEAVSVAGYYLSSRKLGRDFKAAITREQYAVMQVIKAVNDAEALLGRGEAWMTKVLSALPEK